MITEKAILGQWLAVSYPAAAGQLSASKRTGLGARDWGLGKDKRGDQEKSIKPGMAADSELTFPALDLQPPARSP